jgi:hypothetical protein
MGTLLNSSAATRTGLLNAVNQVGACTNLSGAVGQLQAVVNQRASQYSRASALATSALPDGPALKSELIAVLGNSLKADRDYLSWAHQQLDSGCTPFAQSSAYNAAHRENEVADAAKETFVQAWNPVAVKYGIKQNSAENI